MTSRNTRRGVSHRAPSHDIAFSATLPEFLDSWELYLSSRRRSPKTVRTYLLGARSYIAWCQKNDLPPILDAEQVRRWITELLDTSTAVTARTYQNGLNQLRNWMLEEGEIDHDPLANVKLVKTDAKVTPALADQEVEALLKACRGKDFISQRDEAIVRLLSDTGMRAFELLALRVEDLNLIEGTGVIRRGKGGKGRVFAFSPTTSSSIDRYLRHRRRLSVPEGGLLWVGGPTGARKLQYSGFRRALERRAIQAGLDGFHPHLFRHTAATRWLRNGGSETGLMAIAGWANRQMIDRYTAASRSERAIEEARRLGFQ